MQPSPAKPIADLPEDVGVLQEPVRELLASDQAERQRNTELQERIDQLIRRLYGVKSDKLGQNQPARIRLKALLRLRSPKQALTSAMPSKRDDAHVPIAQVTMLRPRNAFACRPHCCLR